MSNTERLACVIFYGELLIQHILLSIVEPWYPSSPSVQIFAIIVFLVKYPTPVFKLLVLAITKWNVEI